MSDLYMRSPNSFGKNEYEGANRPKENWIHEKDDRKIQGHRVSLHLHMKLYFNCNVPKKLWQK